MTLNRVTYYIATLFRSAISFKGLSALLSSFGVLYTILKCADYFQWAQQAEVQKFWWLFLIAGAVLTAWTCRPELSVSCKLRDRDIGIEIAIGDLFSFPGAIVVGANSTFDTLISKDLIAERSVQGQFTKIYYEDHGPLDKELSAGLSAFEYETLNGERIGKAKRYPIGTVVRLQPKNRTGYFLAIAHINKHGVAVGSFEDLKQALGQLWLFVGERGLKEPLVVPVLGTGFARLKQTRQVVVQEIIKSFIAACSERTFCDKLTIVLSPKDVHQIDFAALGGYLRHLCAYTEFAVATRSVRRVMGGFRHPLAMGFLRSARAVDVVRMEPVGKG
jgi:hypothetical protein